MTTVQVLLPPGVNSDIVDFVEVVVRNLDAEPEEQPTFLEGLRRDSIVNVLTFTTRS